MWPFRRSSKKEKHNPLKRIAGGRKYAKKAVVGVVIGGAIGSIIGKKLMEEHGINEEEKEDKDEE